MKKKTLVETILEEKAIQFLASQFQKIIKESFRGNRIESFRTVLEKLQQSTGINLKPNFFPTFWEILNFISRVHHVKSDFKEEIKVHNLALELSCDIFDGEREAATQNNLGRAYIELGSYPEAITCFEECRKISQEISDREIEASAIHGMGVIFTKQGKYQDAIEQFNKALPIAQQVSDDASNFSEEVLKGGIVTPEILQAMLDLAGDRVTSFIEVFENSISDKRREGTVSILNSRGVAYTELNQFDRALEDLNKALEISEAISQAASNFSEATLKVFRNGLEEISSPLRHFFSLNPEDIANFIFTQSRLKEVESLNNIGAVYLQKSEYDRALEYFSRSFKISLEIDSPGLIGNYLNNLGEVYRQQGQFDRAIAEYYQPALETFRKIENQPGEAKTLSNMALVYEQKSQYPKALEYFSHALNIAEKFESKTEKGTILNNRGGVYQSLGQDEKAKEDFENAKSIFKKTGNFLSKAISLNNLGFLQSQHDWNKDKKYNEAQKYYEEASNIFKKNGYRLGEAATINNLGFLYLCQGNASSARDKYQETLALVQKIGNRMWEGRTYIGLGYADYQLGQCQYSEAENHFDRGREILQEIGDRTGEGIALANLGYLYETQGKTSQAIQAYKDSIALTESIQAELKIEELKIHFVKDKIDVYEQLIKLLWQEKEVKQAFHYVEKSRSRSFLDQFTNGKVNFRAGMATPLIEREQKLKHEIQQRQTALNKQSTEAFRKELEDKLQEYKDLRLELRILSPEYSQLTSTEVSSIEEIQDCLELDTTLIEYFVGKQEIFVFTIAGEIFKNKKLKISRAELIKDIENIKKWEYSKTYKKMFAVKLHELNQKLYQQLIEPLLPYLTLPKLAIVPHGCLNYLPFAALSNGEEYLIDRYALYSLPSASILPYLPGKRKSSTSTLLALGNPEIQGQHLPVLKAATEEVKTIAKLYNTQPYIRQHATESRVWSDAKNAEILHLAVHGEYKSKNPLFSALLLAKDDERNGRLEVHEIYELDLTAATNLVVLSACETQTGKVSRGDDIIALNRAFLYAGTPSIIASLWKVDDNSTALLMKQFYTYLRNGMGKAEALRQAQRELRKDPQYSHPYYWAAFVLTGDSGSLV